MWFVHPEKENKITVWLYIALSPSEDTLLNDFYFLLYILVLLFYYSVQFSSVAQSCLTLCDPMSRSMPGLPVHHQLPEFTQTHVH